VVIAKKMRAMTRKIIRALLFAMIRWVLRARNLGLKRPDACRQYGSYWRFSLTGPPFIGGGFHFMIALTA
jgi:hypothetical protein